MKRFIALVLAAAGCASVTARPIEPAAQPAHPAGVLHLQWRTTLHEHGLFEPDPEECATPALADGHLVLGTRAGAVVGVAPATGHVDWITPLSGGVDGVARFDQAHGQVYVGADDGAFYAVDPSSGAVRWTYRGKGAIERPPELGGDLVYVGDRHRSRSSRWRRPPANGAGSTSVRCPTASRFTATPARACTASTC